MQHRISTHLFAMIAISLATSAVTLAQDSNTPPPPTSQPATQPADGNPNPAAEGFDETGSDARAIELADNVMKKMGGRKAWDETRYITWNFFGRRRHVWDKHTGNLRLDGTMRETGQPFVLIMNIHTGNGQAWVDGEPVEDAEELRTMLDGGLGAWINDSYWLCMPYKLKDSGVTLKHLGARAMLDGREAEVLELTFKDVGRTPFNKYHVYVARDSSLVEQWDFFGTHDDVEVAFQIPWLAWTKYGRILLSGDRGDGRLLTDIAVFDELPESVFKDVEVDLESLIRGASESSASEAKP